MDQCYFSLSKESKVILNAPFSVKEIKRVAFDLGKLKAPGPDGFLARFFQEFWECTGDDIANAILEFFTRAILLSPLTKPL